MSWLFRRGSPGGAVNSVINARKNAATKGLSSALTKLANSIRKIRRNNPLENGTNRNNLMKLTENNRTNVNRHIQNYIMAVNKASYKNMKAQNAIRKTQNEIIPESAAVAPVIEAAKANERVAQTGNKLNQIATQAPRQANQRPANQRPANQRPANQRSANQRSANQRPANQRPANQRPANQRPANQRAANQQPAARTRGFRSANQPSQGNSLSGLNRYLSRPVPAKMSKERAQMLRTGLNSYVSRARNAGALNEAKNKQIENYRSKINEASKN